MMQNEPENKPVVGDDGELLTDDPYVDVEVYFEHIFGPRPIPPTPWQRIKKFIRLNRTASVFIIFVALMIFSSFGSPMNRSTIDRQVYADLEAESTQLMATTVARTMPIMGQGIKIGSDANVRHILWSPNGTYLAIQNTENDISLWDLSQNRFSPHSFQDQASFAWTADNQFVTVQSNPDAGQPSLLVMRSIVGSSIKVTQRFQVDDPTKMMVISRFDQTALLYANGLTIDIVGRSEPRSLFTHTFGNGVRDIEWINSGSWLSVIDPYGIWRLMPSDQSHQSLSLLLAGDYQNMSWAAGGTQFAVTQDIMYDDLHQPTVSLFIIGKSIPQWTNALSPDSKSIKDSEAFSVQVDWSFISNRIATFLEGDTAVDVWDSQDGLHIQRLKFDSGILTLDWSPDGKYLAVGSTSGVYIWSPAYKVG